MLKVSLAWRRKLESVRNSSWRKKHINKPLWSELFVIARRNNSVKLEKRLMKSITIYNDRDVGVKNWKTFDEFSLLEVLWTRQRTRHRLKNKSEKRRKITFYFLSVGSFSVSHDMHVPLKVCEWLNYIISEHWFYDCPKFVYLGS